MIADVRLNGWSRIGFGLVLLAMGMASAGAQPVQGSPWSLGVAALTAQPLQSDGDRDLLLVPLLGYEGERVFLRGLAAGIRGGERDGVNWRLQLQPRMQSLDAGDAPGLDGIRERRRALEAAVGVSTGSVVWAPDFQVAVDVSGRHDGSEATLRWSLPMLESAGTRLALEPALQWQSADLVDYYAGVDDDEVRPGRPAYRAGSALNPELAVALRHRLAPDWSLGVRLAGSWLDDEIRESPLVDRSTRWTALVSLIRRFP